jgi:hypothetical protein
MRKACGNVVVQTWCKRGISRGIFAHPNPQTILGGYKFGSCASFVRLVLTWLYTGVSCYLPLFLSGLYTSSTGSITKTTTYI